MSLKELKQYLRVDYTDDDSMIELMHDAVIDEMKELISSLIRKSQQIGRKY